MDNKPLFGTVAHGGKFFTMHYHKKTHKTGLKECAINRSGYDRSVFDGCNVPIVRFDMASLQNVLESIKGEVDEIEEYYHLSPWSKPISFNDYLIKLEKNNIPIEY